MADVDGLDDLVALARASAAGADGDTGEPIRAALAGLARGIAESAGVPLDRAGARLLVGERGAPLPVPERLARPETLGRVYEALLAPDRRRRAGAFFTPEPVARGLADATLADLSAPDGAPRVLDPAAGGGAFLLAAGRHLVARGAEPRAAVGCLYGLDRDPLAVAVTEAALLLFGWDGTAFPTGLGERLRAEDAFRADLGAWAPVDAVVGNPPFLSQLRADTTRSREHAAAARARFGTAAGGYADTAALFLLLGLETARPGGRIGVVLPESVLASRDTAGIRAQAAERAALRWAWLARDKVFAAGARVWAPVLEVGTAQPATVPRRIGADLAALPPARVPAAGLTGRRGWGWLFADALGVPPVALPSTPTLRDHCRATADFRDQYYGLVPFVVDEPEHPDGLPYLITSGLLDPATCAWGRRSTRFAKRRFARPRIDLSRLERDSDLGPWARTRLRPKVLLATQTRVLEAAVDEEGSWLPCTPVITVEAPPERLWHVAAALLAPPVTAWALRRHAGAALSTDALKLRAAEVLELPAPTRDSAWDAAAAAVRRAAGAGDEQTWRAHLVEAGRHGCRAYNQHDASALLSWWVARLPRWRADGRA